MNPCPSLAEQLFGQPVFPDPLAEAIRKTVRTSAIVRVAHEP